MRKLSCIALVGILGLVGACAGVDESNTAEQSTAALTVVAPAPTLDPGTIRMGADGSPTCPGLIRMGADGSPSCPNGSVRMGADGSPTCSCPVR